MYTNTQDTEGARFRGFGWFGLDVKDGGAISSHEKLGRLLVVGI
jgi:hypothetical protein